MASEREFLIAKLSDTMDQDGATAFVDLVIAEALSGDPSPVRASAQEQAERLLDQIEREDITQEIDYPYELDRDTAIPRVLAALTAAEARGRQQAEQVGWQSIETAPKDGPNLLLFSHGEIHLGYWVRTMWMDDYGQLSPTHWQPLPAPPKG